jgi:hypothetical protein
MGIGNMEIFARLVSIKNPTHLFEQKSGIEQFEYFDANTIFADIGPFKGTSNPVKNNFERLSYEDFNFLEIFPMVIGTYSVSDEQIKMIREYVNTGLVTIIFCGMSEVTHRFHYERSFKRLKDLGVNTKSIIILEADKNNSKYYENSIDFWWDLIHTKAQSQDSRGSWSDKYFEESLGYFDTTKLKPKKFLCLNNVYRLHRLYVVYTLIKDFDSAAIRNSSYEGYISLVGIYQLLQSDFSNHPLVGIFEKLKEMLIFLDEYDGDEKIYKFISQLPLVVDVEVMNDELAGGFHGIMPPFNILNDCYFSIVNECCFGNLVFLGDKMYGGITKEQDKEYYKNSLWPCCKILKHICFLPTILIGDPHSLKYIKSHGFKTFHPFINESYDEVDNDKKRLKMVMKEIDRLSKMEMKELHEMWLKCIPIMKHNIEVLKNVDIEKMYIDVSNQVCDRVTEFRESLK